MSSYRTTAAVIGALFLISYTGFSIGMALVVPSLDPSADLARIGLDEQRLITGALFLFVNMAAIVGIAAMLFPVMRPHGEGLALWYVGFRILEAAAFVVGAVSVLSLISVSEASIVAAGPSAPVYEGIRSMALAANSWAGKLATVAFISGAIVLYTLLYRSRLVPRFIAVWGLVAVALLIVANLLAVDVTAGFQPAALLFAPIALNELFLAGWLIVRGFKAPMLASDLAVAPQPA
jgi:Domain of unknown function (DUF4386)